MNKKYYIELYYDGEWHRWQNYEYREKDNAQRSIDYNIKKFSSDASGIIKELRGDITEELREELLGIWQNARIISSEEVLWN